MEKDFKRRQYYLTFEKLNKLKEEEDKNLREEAYKEEEPKEEPKESKLKRLINAIYEMLKVYEIEIKNFDRDIRIDIQDLDRQSIVEVYIETNGKAVIELNNFTNVNVDESEGITLTEKSLISEVEFFLLSQHQAYVDMMCEDQGIRFNFDELFRDL